MDPIWQWGIDLISSVQQVRTPGLDVLFRAITFLGEEEFYLLLLPLFLWCVDFSMGTRLGLIFLFSTITNSLAKDVIGHPRPYDLNPAVGVTSAEGYGLPSGHAQLSAAVWGYVAMWSRRAWAWWAAVALSGLIGVSRIYLGVHFPTDVLGGWLLGVLTLVVYARTGAAIEGWIRRQSLRTHLALAVAVPLGVLAVHPVKGMASSLGALAGVAAGLALAMRLVRFDASGSWLRRALRLPVGLTVTLVFYVGLAAIFPPEGGTLYLLLRFVRYALVGLWITLGAPWFFQVLHLAKAPAGR